MNIFVIFLCVAIGDLQHVEEDPAGTGSVNAPRPSDSLKIMAASSSVMHYFLNKLPDVLKSKILVTDEAEKVVLEHYVKSMNVPPEALDAYNSAKKDERELLKRLYSEMPQIAATYKALRKGLVWNYTRLSDEFRTFFEKRSSALAQYEALKSDELASLDSFLADSSKSGATGGTNHTASIEEETKHYQKAEQSEKRDIDEIETEDTEEADDRKTNEKEKSAVVEKREEEVKEKGRGLVEQSFGGFKTAEDEDARRLRDQEYEDNEEDESDDEEDENDDEEYFMLTDTEVKRRKKAEELEKEANVEYVMIRSVDAKSRLEDKEDLTIVAADDAVEMTDFKRAVAEVPGERLNREKGEKEAKEAGILKDKKEADYEGTQHDLSSAGKEDEQARIAEGEGQTQESKSVGKASAKEAGKEKTKVSKSKEKDSSEQPYCGSIKVDMTYAQRFRIREAHNEVRRMENATNMLRMVWDYELAMIAQHKANTCGYFKSMTKDCNRQVLGQNLYANFTRSPGRGTSYPSLNFPLIVYEWADEGKDWDWATSTCRKGKECGRWQIATGAKVWKVGCGKAKCPTLDVNGVLRHKATFLVCNYSPLSMEFERGNRCSNCGNSTAELDEKGFICETDLCVKCDPKKKPGCRCGRELRCRNGGQYLAETCGCKCPRGYYGATCEINYEDRPLGSLNENDSRNSLHV